MRKHSPKATGSDSASKDDSSKSEDIDAQGEIAEGEDEEMQELASQTSHMSAHDARQDEPEIPRFNDMIGDNTYNSDNLDARSDYSHGSWYHVPTPLPSPPGSPPPEQDNFQDEAPELGDEDGFQNINAGDFREYERWYAEDHLGEDVEMLAETLTEEEIDSIIMLAIHQFGSVTQSDYERIRYSYRQKLELLSPYRLRTRIARLSGVDPKNIDCCVNSCHAFHGKYIDKEVCSSCNEPCYDYKGRPRQFFQYLPATPRFLAFFNNPDLIHKMLYRHNYKRKPGCMDDFFNSELYEDLLATNIVIDGVDTGVRHFPGKHDIAIAVMSDGILLFDQGSKEPTCWPIMAQNLNLPPAEHAQMRNLTPLGVIPGPNKPKDFDSFLLLFVEECIELAKGVEAYNTITGQTFTLRAHPVIISGDMQAIKYIQNFKGPNARLPCRECLMEGVYHHAKKTYYIPLAQPLDDPSSSTVDTYDPHNLLL
ncbi:transposase family Tnp2 protein, partial [Rhizoctonia solani AG-3 Rhs1AP]